MWVWESGVIQTQHCTSWSVDDDWPRTSEDWQFSVFSSLLRGPSLCASPPEERINCICGGSVKVLTFPSHPPTHRNCVLLFLSKYVCAIYNSCNKFIFFSKTVNSRRTFFLLFLFLKNCSLWWTDFQFHLLFFNWQDVVAPIQKKKRTAGVSFNNKWSNAWLNQHLEFFFAVQKRSSLHFK